MGSPDERQIDGMGGADPLTSKIAVVGPPTRPDADIDYLFLQVVVDEPRVDASQNCGNILAGVGPFAIERGLVKPTGDLTRVRIHMVNTNSIAIASVETPGHGDRRAGPATRLPPTSGQQRRKSRSDGDAEALRHRSVSERGA